MLKEYEIDIFGYIAGLLLVISFIPQIIKIIQLKSAEEISIWFLIVQFVVNIMLITYGVFLEEMPIYLPSGVLLVEKFAIIVLKYYYHCKKTKEDEDDIEMQNNIEISKSKL